jgi:hypothetical protein
MIPFEKALRNILSSPGFYFAASGAFIGYSILFAYILQLSGPASILTAGTQLLSILLVVSSSVLAGIAWVSSGTLRRRRPTAGISVGTSTVASGALVVTCLCSAPLLAQALYLLGANALEVSSFLTLLSMSQVEVVAGFVLVNFSSAFLLFLQIGKTLR